MLELRLLVEVGTSETRVVPRVAGCFARFQQLPTFLLCGPCASS